LLFYIIAYTTLNKLFAVFLHIIFYRNETDKNGVAFFIWDTE